jgi:hypothetical protein
VGTVLPAGDKLTAGTYYTFAIGTDKAGNIKNSLTNTFTVTATAQSEPLTAAAEGTVSPVTLSTVSATSQSVTLVFTGALNASTATDPTRYRVTVGSVTVELESAALSNSSTVVLGLGEGAVKVGDRLQVTYDVKDSAGRLIRGEVSVTVR